MSKSARSPLQRDSSPLSNPMVATPPRAKRSSSFGHLDFHRNSSSPLHSSPLTQSSLRTSSFRFNTSHDNSPTLEQSMDPIVQSSSSNPDHSKHDIESYFHPHPPPSPPPQSQTRRPSFPGRPRAFSGPAVTSDPPQSDQQHTSPSPLGKLSSGARAYSSPRLSLSFSSSTNMQYVPGHTRVDAKPHPFSERSRKRPPLQMRAELAAGKFVYSQGDKVTTWSRIQLKGVIDPSFLPRHHSHICLVLDCSSSMRGKRIAALKQAATSVLSMLKEKDTLHAISFNDKPQICLANVTQSKLKGAGYSSAVNAINRLNPSGGTNMIPALTMATNTLSSSHLDTGDRGGRKHIIVVSDGRSSEEDKEVIKCVNRMQQLGITVTTVGVGALFNDELLMAVADEGKGRFIFVENDSELQYCLEMELAYFDAVLAHNLLVEIVGHDGVVISDIVGYPCENMPPGTSIAVSQPANTLLTQGHRPSSPSSSMIDSPSSHRKRAQLSSLITAGRVSYRGVHCGPVTGGEPIDMLVKMEYIHPAVSKYRIPLMSIYISYTDTLGHKFIQASSLCGDLITVDRGELSRTQHLRGPCVEYVIAKINAVSVATALRRAAAASMMRKKRKETDITSTDEVEDEEFEEDLDSIQQSGSPKSSQNGPSAYISSIFKRSSSTSSLTSRKNKSIEIAAAIKPPLLLLREHISVILSEIDPDEMELRKNVQDLWTRLERNIRTVGKPGAYQRFELFRKKMVALARDFERRCRKSEKE
ncbi:hypothetical protein ADUPG1_008630 [Aduncisulcus paluster]|uniref:VWFA domain-containing protein n=1 Tax=Aduncisulcus paluster TaxID=2918883 RepID=A0ABQ5KVL5_9EUKA|nr:hypothetical protein ADUPG1_008630 [Aduncisulcus paluster]